MEIKKNKRTKEQGAETKIQLYRCAEALLVKQDYDDVSVENITKMAGVSKGTFYVHFDSKDELYIAILTQFVENVDEQYERFLYALSPEITSYDRMLALVEGTIDIMTNQIGYKNLKTLYRLQISKTISTEVVNGYNRRLYSFFAQVLKQGIDQGEFMSDLSLETLTQHFVMAIRGLTYEWLIRYLDFDLKKEANTHFQLLLDGILTQT